MKNAIVTVICILAIVITTALVTLCDDRQAYDFGFETTSASSDNR